MPIQSTRGAGSAKGFGFGADLVNICATGGTITTCGPYKIHSFTGPGSFVVNKAKGSATVDYLVVAGGGGGGANGSGAGAGGWRASSGTASGSYSAGPAPLVSPVSAIPVSVQSYPITVGAGGSGTVVHPPTASPGGPSIFSTITSTGGGKGGQRGPQGVPGDPGGSGGGGGDFGGVAGNGNSPPTSPPQGNNGGNGSGGEAGGGGGGAGGSGGAGNGSPGPGVNSSITGSSLLYARGGSGDCSPTPGPSGDGPNRGFGGTPGENGAAGGVIIRYLYK